MSQLSTLYAIGCVAAVVLALASRRLRELPLSEPLVAVLLGIAAGPTMLGWPVLDAHTRDVALLEG